MNQFTFPFVSIVLLNYNGRKYSKHWDSLFSLDYPKDRYEIIFVDNGSSDGSGDVFFDYAKEFPSVSTRMVRLVKNCGYSEGNNIGIEKTKGEYVVLLSNDIRVSKNWLKEATVVLESDKQIGVAQSMMYKLDQNSKPDEMGNYIDVFGFNYSFCFNGQVKEVSYCEGAVMFIRRKILTETNGLFDKSYFMFYEDVDFCWRARLAGYKMIVLPDSVVYHKRGGTVSGVLMKMEPLYVFCNTRNRLKTLFKNYSIGNLLRFLPFALALETTKGTMLAFKGKTAAGIACYKGILAFVVGLGKDTSKRHFIQARRAVDDSVVIRYLIPSKEALANLFRSAVLLESEWNN